MPSSELLNDLTSEPISRRTVTAGLWAAPVIALTVAAPAVAASTTLTVLGSGQGSKRTWTVNYSGMPANTTITVVVEGSNLNQTVQLTAPQSSPERILTVTVSGTGSFSFIGHANPTGTVSGGGITNVPFLQ